MKITYEGWYRDLQLDVPFENLLQVQATIPKGILDSIKTGYERLIEEGEYDMTFEEYLGLIMIAGILSAEILGSV